MYHQRRIPMKGVLLLRVRAYIEKTSDGEECAVFGKRKEKRETSG